MHDRRQFLTVLGTAGVAAVAGCSRITGGASDADSPPATQTAKLMAADGVPDAQFGDSVAMSADGTMGVVGANNHIDTNGVRTGAAYVFDANGGSWTQQTKLTPKNGTADDEFGRAVAVSDDLRTVIVGARKDSANGHNAGAAYVFDGSNGSWTQRTKITPDDGDSDDFFGDTVALSNDGTTAVIGAFGDENPNEKNAGTAYVFTMTGDGWTQQAKLVPDDGDARDFFGKSIALAADGTTVLIGADEDDEPNGRASGAVYVFTAEGERWTQQAKLTPQDGDSNDMFGWSVAVAADGTTAIIGAVLDEDPNGFHAGSAYVFTADDGSWSEQAKLAPDDGSTEEKFGWAVDLSAGGTIAVVSAVTDNDNGPAAGSVFGFSRSEGSWSHETKLTADDGDAGDRFGGAVALSADGGHTLVGAIFETDQNGAKTGGAYVFE